MGGSKNDTKNRENIAWGSRWGSIPGGLRASCWIQSQRWWRPTPHQTPVRSPSESGASLQQGEPWRRASQLSAEDSTACHVFAARNFYNKQQVIDYLRFYHPIDIWVRPELGSGSHKFLAIFGTEQVPDLHQLRQVWTPRGSIDDAGDGLLQFRGAISVTWIRYPSMNS